MIVHRLLDALFRGLDTVDAVRDRVDRVLGREPRPDPWAVDWPPEDMMRDAPPEATASAEPKPEAEKAAPTEEKDAAPKQAKKTEKAEPSKSAAPATADAPPAKTAKPKRATASKAKKEGKPGRKKSKASNRKGSVDRSGKDLSTPRAEKVSEYAEGKNIPPLSEDADVDGKKVLARVVWSLELAARAGEAEGLTTKDMSALLSHFAKIEVFTTNIGRACRDYDDLITASVPDGRSKRYRLTSAGQKRAESLLG